MEHHHQPKTRRPVSRLPAVVLCAVLLATTLFSSVDHLFQADPFAASEASRFNGSAQYHTSAPANAAGAMQEQQLVIPLGTPFGIKLFTDGIIVASLSDLDTQGGIRCPAKEAGIQPGDYIVAVNGESVGSNAELAKRIGASGGNTITLQVRRGSEHFETQVTPVFAGDSFKTGMWIRDSAAGIGTLTFYSADTEIFAGLGHGICDMDTNGIMDMDHGEPAPITLCGIIPGEKDAPGQLQGFFSSDKPLGQLLENNETGIYGTLDTPPQGVPIPVASRDEVREGPAKILTTIDNSGPQWYDVEIQAINSRQQRTRNLVVRVTDDALLAKTGGIVQGMSGSPIIQNDKLVGAVTHVFTEDPTTGYGIYAATMMEESVVYSMSKKIGL